MSPQELKGWRHKSTDQINAYVSNLYLYSVPIPNKSKVICTYIGQSYSGQPLLTLEFSLPKLLYGNNVQEIADLDAAIFSANEIIAGLPGIPSVDISKGEILRLDIAYNHQVDDNLLSYLDYLSRQTISRRKTRSYLFESTYFANKTVSTVFYDKHKEEKLPTAKGILRQEVKYTNKKVIRTLFDAKYLGELCFPAIKTELEKDLKVLGLNKTVLGDGRQAWKHLVMEHEFYAGSMYYGLLKAKERYPIDEIEAIGHHRSINRLIKNAVSSGIAPGFSTSGKDLPPLSIDWDIVNSKKIVIKSGRSPEGLFLETIND